MTRLRAFLTGHWQLLALTAVIFALWTTPVVVPLKILVVYLHELSHAAAAVLTGGSVDQINVSPQMGGFAITRGGSRFAILTAGYLGSLFIGAGLLVAALRSHADRYVTGLLGGLTLLVTVLYMRDFFTIGFGVATGVALLTCARFLGHAINDLVLRVIGLASMIYVPYDIFDDTIRRSQLRSDARMLAEEFGGTTVFWGMLWLVISVAVIGLALRFGLGRDSNVDFRKLRR